MSTGDAGSRVVVVMGVSGSGKSTVGEELARRLGVPFADADDFHPESNKEKMAAGQPLTDDDRWPWLDEVGAWLAEHAPPGGAGGVVTCSALKRSYRDVLRRHAPGAWCLHLVGSREVIAERQAGRSGHFMPSSLLDSQFDTLEPLESDEPGVEVDVTASADDVVAAALDRLAAG